jgi:hypothetical protein
VPDTVQQPCTEQATVSIWHTTLMASVATPACNMLGICMLLCLHVHANNHHAEYSASHPPSNAALVDLTWGSASQHILQGAGRGPPATILFQPQQEAGRPGIRLGWQVGFGGCLHPTGQCMGHLQPWGKQPCDSLEGCIQRKGAGTYCNQHLWPVPCCAYHSKHQ